MHGIVHFPRRKKAIIRVRYVMRAVQKEDAVPALCIYVIKDDYLSCRMTFEVVHQLRRLLPDVAVNIIDLQVPGAIKPNTVFAVPTYLWDNTIIALGNPDAMWLAEKIQTKLGQAE